MTRTSDPRPSTGLHPHSSRRGFVVEGDPASFIGRIDRHRHRLEQSMIRNALAQSEKIESLGIH